MTKTELNLYQKSEKAGFIGSEVYATIHEIFYDPMGGTDEDAADMENLIRILEQAMKIAARVEKRLHG